MDWKRAMEEEQAALMRIVALILALADLAELACGRSSAVRGFVFWILHPTESVLREFVGALPAPAVRSGDICTDLSDLASRLRALARDVERQARPVLSLRDSDAGRPEPFPHCAGRMSRIVEFVRTLDLVRPTLAPDTS